MCGLSHAARGQSGSGRIPRSVVDFMIRLPALGEWLLIEMAVSRFGEFVLLIHYSRSDFSIAAVPLNPNWVELDATKRPFVILHNRPLCTVPNYVHLEHGNLLAPMRNGGIGLCRLHIILAFSSYRIVREIKVSTERGAQFSRLSQDGIFSFAQACWAIRPTAFLRTRSS